MIRRCLSGVATCFFAELLAAIACATVNADDRPLAERAYQVLDRYCVQCHGINDEVGNGFRVLDRDSLTAAEDGERLAYITPGEPAKSLLWIKAVKERSMPPSYAEQHPVPTDEERATLEEWIKAGAPFPAGEQRQFIEETAILQGALDDLEDLKEHDRPFHRYFSLANLNNNRTDCSTKQINITRAAVSKLINSLSWKPTIVVPRPVGPGDVLLAIDLRDYGWTHENHWRRVSRSYPYGIKRGEDPIWLKLTSELRDQTGAYFPIVRADWFVANMSRAPFYDQLLELPEDVASLELLLGIDYLPSFNSNTIARAGLVTSQVSHHNRVVERHVTKHGSYWRSFDFRSSEERSNILQFPLGPKQPEHAFAQQAFVHAGGEFIFSLPNGLQAYLLADQNDKRLDAPAPIDIVRDLTESAGGPQIVNGLSCIACHSRGMKPVRDAVRELPAVFGEARLKVERLYVKTDVMDRFLADDETRFLQAATTATASFLRSSTDESRSVTSFEEPVSAVARLYFRDISATAAAAELGMRDAEDLQTLIHNNVTLQKMGFGPLLAARSIKRTSWEQRKGSLYGLINRELRRTVDRDL